MNIRVSVSGYGAVTPYGVGVKSSFSGLLQGRDVYRTATGLDLADDYFSQKKIAEIPDALIDEHNLSWDLHPHADATKLTLMALEEALAQAKLSTDRLSQRRVGVAITTLESHVLEALAVMMQDYTSAIDAALMNLVDPEYCLQEIRNLTGAAGAGMVLSNACASGNHAIAAGVDLIRSGEVDLAIVGGGCKIFQSAVVGFHQFQGISPDTCRPFSGNRSGTMLGDGAGILILESRDYARDRGFDPMIDIAGYGTSCDAYDMMAPHPEGLGMKLAMQRALEMADLKPDAIQYINAHGTATFQNDRLETMSIRRVFGHHADQLMVSSTKSLLGHSLYAASALEAVWCCCALEHGQIPPTMNYETADQECDLNYVVNQSRIADVSCCMNNSFGFGGSNSSVIFCKVD
ncbi:MAG: beta-ketoacyl-[acyl-carrier-protein] synthase family protein [Cyanobacteria bacterium CRU_2_1]|nr:beta-ketoacyl-[acyl-carrier-protein] synthase family protein [Cyanobacteria bacterium CRU_2_1]